MSNIVKDWTTKSGLRAVILLNGGRNHCGYVEVKEDNALFEKDYSDECCPQLEDGTEMGKRNPIAWLMNAMSGASLSTPSVYFEVHGGITFSDRFEHESDGWWFGYDCAHAGDLVKSEGMPHFQGDVWRDEEYCIKECEKLAKQLVKFKLEEEEENV